MTAHDALTPFLSSAALFFLVAGLVVPILQRLRIPATLGYVLAGIALGPFGLSSLAKSNATLMDLQQGGMMALLGDLGIMALLFMIGLELSFDRLRAMRRLALSLGSAQIILTGAVIGTVLWMFDNTVTTAVLLGICLALSSTAMVMQDLGEKNLTARPLGILCFSILLMQDLAVVPLLILVGGLTTQEMSSGNLGLLIVQSIGLTVAILGGMIIFGRRLLRPLMHSVSAARNSEWLMAFVLLSVSGAALITHQAGLSPALGAFLAGLLVAETAYRHEVHVILEPLKGMLLGIFFLSIGMMIDVRAVVQYPILLMASVLGLFMIKAIVFYPLARLFGNSHLQSIESSLMLAQAGEFAFVLIRVMMEGNLINHTSGQFFLLVSALSMMMAPVIFYFVPRVRTFLHPATPNETPMGTPEVPFVLIVGLGRVGRQITLRLQDARHTYWAMDRRLSAIHAAQHDGISAFYGDIRNIQHVHDAVAAGAYAVILAIDSLPLTLEITQVIRRHYPTLPLIIRAHNSGSVEALYNHGATVVVAEDAGLAEALVKGLDDKGFVTES